MRWINFPDGSKYTFAVDIQKFAEANGYKVPCEQDGTRHPGTDCNQKMRAIYKDAGMRRTFEIVETSVVVIKAEDSLINSCFLNWLADSKIVSDYYARKGEVQLYTIEAVNALLSSMLRLPVKYVIDDADQEWNFSMLANKRSHNLEKKMYKPKASLFKK